MHEKPAGGILEPAAAFTTAEGEQPDMGGWSESKPGQKAPNSGKYRKVGGNDRIAGIEDPRIIELEKGERFPPATGKNRKWVRLKGGPAKTGKAGWRGMAQTGFVFFDFSSFPGCNLFSSL